MSEYNPNCGKCGMLNSRGFCSLTACRYPANVIAVQPARVSFIPKPTSWGDKIRAMSDEELAEWLAKYNERSVVCPNFGARDCQATCKQCWLDWLKAPADKEDAKAHWVRKHDDVCYWSECSSCGGKMPLDQWRQEWESPYCPNCGAKMDGETDG